MAIRVDATTGPDAHRGAAQLEMLVAQLPTCATTRCTARRRSSRACDDTVRSVLFGEDPVADPAQNTPRACASTTAASCSSSVTEKHDVPSDWHLTK